MEGLAVMLLEIATVAFGAGSLKAGAIPRWAAWLLMLSPALGVGVAFLVAYVPHGLLLPYSLTWAAIGLSLGVTPARSDDPGVRPSEASSP